MLWNSVLLPKFFGVENDNPTSPIRHEPIEKISYMGDKKWVNPHKPCIIFAQTNNNGINLRESHPVTVPPQSRQYARRTLTSAGYSQPREPRHDRHGSVGVLRQALTTQNPTDNDSGSRWSRPKLHFAKFQELNWKTA